MKKLSREEIQKELIVITSRLLDEAAEPYHREVKLTSSLQRHLGIDSLGRAELFRRIEQSFDISLPDKLLAEVETLDDIAHYLQTADSSSKPSSLANQTIMTSHGEHARVDPATKHTLQDILLLYGQQAPDKVHIYFQHEDGHEETITYGKLLSKALQVAYSLRERGLKEADTVAIMLPTTPGFFYVFFGTLLAGGIPVPIYPPFRMHGLEAYAKTEARILSNAEVRILVTFDQAEQFSHLLRSFVPSLKHVATVDELLQTETLDSVFSARHDQFALIQYTSGSTAAPKGVVLTHDNLLSNLRAYSKAIKITADDVAVSWLPLYHDMGLIGMWLGSLYYGVPLILLTPFTFLNHPERWLWAIHYHRGTLSGAPNFAYELCVRKIGDSLLEGLDLSSWRMAANGAEKIYPRTLEQFAQKFAPYGFKRETLLPVYGLAESTVGLVIPDVDREFHIDYVDRQAFEADSEAKAAPNDRQALAFVSCGKAMEGHEVRIVDQEGKVLPERHVGTLEFRGPSSMQGYYRNPEATRAIYHDGWLDSGDLAYQAEGEIYITGRRKDLIIKAGRNIYPAEIEEIVGDIAGIRQGCVTAFSVTECQDIAEQLIVVAETRESRKTERQQLIDKIKEQLAAHLDAVPDHVILVAPHVVPKTSSGKLQRAACKKMYLEGKLSKIQSPVWLQMTRLAAKSVMQNISKAFVWTAKVIYSIYVALILVVTLFPVYFIVRFSSREMAISTCRLWARMLLALAFCPIKVIHSAKLSVKSPVIYVANHASYMDSLLLLALLPPSTRLVGKKELLTTPIMRTFMRKLDYISVDRMDFSKGIENILQVEQVLKTGVSILIFPEGTFSYSAGLRPFRLGAFKIAAETKLPICPIALQGTRRILRDDEKLMRPGRITVTVCDLIQPIGSEWNEVTQLRNVVRAEIAKYCGEPSLDFIAAQIIAPKPFKQTEIEK